MLTTMAEERGDHDALNLTDQEREVFSDFVTRMENEPVQRFPKGGSLPLGHDFDR